MMHYKKGKNVEEEFSRDRIPIEVLPENFLWMQVKGGTSVPNVVEYAKKALDDGTYRSVVWSGSDGGVGKTVSCAEILKRQFELHQVTRICYKKVEEFWDPQQDGLEQIVAKRKVPSVHILLSLDEINPKVAGYQHSKVPGGFWKNATVTDSNDRGRNYFTGPQLNQKANRKYVGNNHGGTGTVDNGRGGGAGGSKKKGGKPQGRRSKTPNKGPSGGKGNNGKQGKQKKNSGKNQNATQKGKDGKTPMDTSDGATTSKH